MSKYIANDDIFYPDLAEEVYINKFNIKDAKTLQAVEQYIVTNKLFEIEKYPKGNFNLSHLCMLHKYFFADLYSWAGKIRDVDIVKGDTRFCNVRFIISEFNKFYHQVEQQQFLKKVKQQELHIYLASYYADLNMIHPFREGNGRTLRAYLSLMVYEAFGIVLNYSKINVKKWLNASIASAVDDNELLIAEFKKILQNT